MLGAVGEHQQQFGSDLQRYGGVQEDGADASPARVLLVRG